MKRNLDLVRSILLECENLPFPNLDDTIQVEGFTKSQVDYHLTLLSDAGFVEIAQYNMGDDEIDVIPLRITWQGHEFMDAARNDTRWKKAAEILGPIGGFTFDILKSLLTDLLARDIGLGG